MRLSIIIPTVNRCRALRRTLDSVASLAMDWDKVEVVVVDNGSVDGTRQACEEVQSMFPQRRWRYLYEPIPGLLSGRHRGALEATGDICAFLDDDVRVGRDWPIALAQAFNDSQIALVGGPSTPLFESNPPAWLADFYSEHHEGRFCGWLSLFDGGTRAKEIDPRFVWGLNFSIRKNILFEYGGFHPDNIPKLLQRFQGDGETGLSLNLVRAKVKALYHPQASVQHEIPASRLTAEYFEERALYQGVCDSYTHIRAARGVANAGKPWKDSFRRIGTILSRVTSTNTSLAHKLRNRTADAYHAGYRSHQQEVRGDPKLLEWVLREHYWDCFLPAGWQVFANPADRK